MPLATSLWASGGSSISPDLLIAGNAPDSTSSSSGALPSGQPTVLGTSVPTNPVWPALAIRSAGAAVGLSGPTSPLGSPVGANTNWMILTTQDQASAQIVPSEPHTSVFGDLNAAAPSRVFEILSVARTRDLGIELSPTGATDAPLEMTVFDSSGRRIAESGPSSGPDERPLAMNLTADQLSQSSGLYVKVAAPVSSLDSSSSSSGMGSDSFVLQITRDPEVGWPLSSSAQNLTPPVHLGDGTLASAQGMFRSDLETGWETSAPGSADSAQAEVALGAPPPVSSALPGQQPLSTAVVATGPLPERSGAPLGGVLAEGDPVPQIDRHDPALVDLALIGLPEPEPLPGLGEANLDAMVAELNPASEEAEGLVAIRGPGGFRLLASSLHGERVRDSDALIAVLPAVATAPVASPRPAPAAVPVETVAEPRRKPIRTASMLSGVTVAMAMVFSLVLPDVSRLMTIVEAPRFRLWFRFRRRDTFLSPYYVLRRR